MTEHQDKLRPRNLTIADKLLDLADEKASLVRTAYELHNQNKARFFFQLSNAEA